MQCVLFKKTATFIFHPHSDRMKIMRKRVGERILNAEIVIFRAFHLVFHYQHWRALCSDSRVTEGEGNIIKNAKYKTNTVKS